MLLVIGGLFVVAVWVQGFPDAVNQSAFPSVLLQPDELYRHEVIYQFSIK